MTRALIPLVSALENPRDSARFVLARGLHFGVCMKTFVRVPSVLFAPFLPLIACGELPEEEVARAVVSSALQTKDSGGIGNEVVDSVDDTCALDPELAALDAARRPSVAFIPSTCVQKTADGNTLHAELNGCQGRFGRTTVDGGLDAVLEKADGCRLHAEIVDSGDLRANDEPLEYAASAYVQLFDDHRDVDWSADWTGTTPRGHTIVQHSELAIRADNATDCVELMGVAEGRVRRWDYALDIEDLAVCPDECPSAGTVRARVEGMRRERRLTVRFDGSTMARVQGWSGDEFDVEMICAPARE